MMPAFAIPPPSKAVPIPVPGTFEVTPVQSAKAPQGKIKAKLSMAWNDTIMYAGAKLSIFVQPMNKTVTTTLPSRPTPGDAIELTLTLDEAVGMAPFAVGPISITSGPKPATQAPTMPVESLVASTLATAAAATAAAAQTMAPPPRAVVVAQAVSAAPPAPPPARKAPPKVAPKPKAAAKAKAAPKPKVVPKAAPKAKAPKRKAAPTKQVANKRARATSPPPPSPPPLSNRLGRTIKAASRFGDRGEQEGKARDFQSTPVASKAFVPLATEVEVPSFCKKGAYVWATGLVGGVRKPFGFKAVVVAIRSRFPKIHVKYLEDRETASSVRIALPEMREAYLMADAVSEYDGQ